MDHYRSDGCFETSRTGRTPQGAAGTNPYRNLKGDLKTIGTTDECTPESTTSYAAEKNEVGVRGTKVAESFFTWHKDIGEASLLRATTHDSHGSTTRETTTECEGGSLE